MKPALTIILALLLSLGTAWAQDGPLSVEEQKRLSWLEVRDATVTTLSISLMAALITYTMAIATAFSVLYFGPWTRRVLNQMLKTMACVSPLVLLLLVYSVATARGGLLGILLGVAIYPLIGRQLLSRVSEVAGEFHFVQAKILGHGPLNVFAKYAWPRFIPLTLPLFFFGFIYSLMVESMFSSLGLAKLEEGESHTWGSLIREGSIHLLDAPWHVFYPGFAIIVTTLLAYLCIPISAKLLSVPDE